MLVYLIKYLCYTAWRMKHLKLLVLGALFSLQITAPLAFAVDPILDCNILAKTGLDLDFVAKMQANEEALSPELKKLRELVRENGPQAVFLNKSLIKADRGVWTTELETGDICDQKGIGECWGYSGASQWLALMYRYGLLKPNFKISQPYIWFWHLYEQANEHLNRIMVGAPMNYSNPLARSAELAVVSQGGEYINFASIINKYGAVSEDSMPDTTAANTDPSALLEDLSKEIAIGTKALEDANASGANVADKKVIRDHANEMIWSVLTTYLGVPPTKFTIPATDLSASRIPKDQVGKSLIEFTPQQFAQDYGQFSNDFVVLGAYPVHPINTLYTMTKESAQDGVSYTDVTVLNVSPERLLQAGIQSIDKGVSVWVGVDWRDALNESGDLNPAQFDRSAMYQMTAAQNAARQSAQDRSFFGNGPDHAVLWSGYNKDPKTGTYNRHKIVNSWGDKVGLNATPAITTGIPSNTGAYSATPSWMAKNLYEIVVPRSVLTPAELKILQGPATIVSAEAPLNVAKPRAKAPVATSKAGNNSAH